MKVVILCGGLGTRMREETEFRPKPMVPLAGKPILWHLMKFYAHYGFRDFVLCLGYKGEVVKDYFYRYQVHNSDFTVRTGHPGEVSFHGRSSEDWTVTLADTGAHALKGARLKRIERYVDGDDFMVTYGDGLSDIDLPRLLAFHRQHGKLATVTGVRPRSAFGELQLRGHEVTDFVEKPKIGAGVINGGFFVFKRAVFSYLSERDECDFEKGPLETIVAEGQLAAYLHEGAWSCMDTPRDVEHMNRLWASGQAFWKVWD